jgi:dUTP pyrophosphatase|tara:strand:- start:12130 stop:12738 length:609 start_codon:yes stop_codon:yes gene_type:complete
MSGELSNTWKKIKSLSGEEKSTMDDDKLLSHLGVDSKMLQELESETVRSAAESIKPVIKYQNNSTNKDLSYKYMDDSGMDLRANLKETIVVKSFERALVPTGIHFELPESFEIQVRPRSGLAIKNGITVLNTPGTVDRGYNGEIKIILMNLSKDDFIVNHGDRIAQAVVSPVISGRWCNLTKVNNLTQTQRGDGGFGSTGIE